MSDADTNAPQQVPKIVFIVPYRKRQQHLRFFSLYMSANLEKHTDYEIYISHLDDHPRPFNRGAARNIGFLAIKNKYPNHYKSIVFVFNDVDTIPFADIFNYNTSFGTVKHYYGFTFALGGIVAMRGLDFESTNGYPNYWGWGMEDNTLQTRCQQAGLVIDRSQFFKLGSPEVLQLYDGVTRLVSKFDTWKSKNDTSGDGLATIRKLVYTIDRTSSNPSDNIHAISHDKLFYINTTSFSTMFSHEAEEYHNYDLRDNPLQISNPLHGTLRNGLQTQSQDWSNIPYRATVKERTELVQQVGLQRASEIIRARSGFANIPQPMIPAKSAKVRMRIH